MQDPKPIILTLTRTGQVGAAMMGTLTAVGIDIGKLHTLEHRWRDNKPNVSCIPAGRYDCGPHGWEQGTTKKFKRVWHVKDVEGRQAILIHAGNTVHDTQGCILVGLATAGAFVTNSQKAVELLRHAIGTQPFTLIITDPAGGL